MVNIEEIVANSKASQNKEELLGYLTMLSTYHPQVIVEIGAWRGYLLDVFHKMFTPRVLIGIESDPSVIDPEMLGLYDFIIGDSQNSREELLRRYKTQLNIDQPIGPFVEFLFIDGDHHYEAVKKDFEIYSPLVKPGGFIGFHDIALDEPKWVEAGVEVCKLWKEIRHKYNTWENIGKDGTGTGIIQV